MEMHYWADHWELPRDASMAATSMPLLNGFIEKLFVFLPLLWAVTYFVDIKKQLEFNAKPLLYAYYSYNVGFTMAAIPITTVIVNLFEEPSMSTLTPMLWPQMGYFGVFRSYAAFGFLLVNCVNLSVACILRKPFVHVFHQIFEVYVYYCYFKYYPCDRIIFLLYANCLVKGVQYFHELVLMTGQDNESYIPTIVITKKLLRVFEPILTIAVGVYYLNVEATIGWSLIAIGSVDCGFNQFEAEDK